MILMFAFNCFIVENILDVSPNLYSVADFSLSIGVWISDEQIENKQSEFQVDELKIGISQSSRRGVWSFH